MDSQARHVHHSYIWLGGLRSGGIVTVALVLSLAGSLIPPIIDFVNGNQGIGNFWALPLAVLGSILIIALVLGLNVLIYWISWRYLTYELTDEEFCLRSGVFSKKRSHVPYPRVQSVDVRASLLQRIAGVCSVEIDTAGGSGNKSIVLPYVTKSDAARLKEELFRRKRIALSPAGTAAVPAEQGNQTAMNVLDGVEHAFSETVGIFDQDNFVEEYPVSFKVGLSNKELFLAGLSGANGSVAAILFSVLAFACTFGIMDLVADGLGGYLDSYFDNGLQSGIAMSTLISHLIVSALPYLVAACVLAFAGTFLFSAVLTLISYGGFQARRRGTRIEVERGLLQHQTQGIDIERVQVLRVEQGWIRRLIGCCRVSVGRIDSIGSDEGSNKQAELDLAQGVVVHPFLKVSELDAFVNGLVPELACACRVKVTPPARGLRRAVVRGALWFNAGFWTLIAFLVTYLIVFMTLSFEAPEDLEIFRSVTAGLWPVLVLLLAVMVVGAVRGVLWHRGSSLEYGNGFVHVVNEGFSRKEVVVPRKKIQFATLAANPFQLLGGYRTVHVTTAAGSGETSETIWDIDLEDAEAFYDWVRPKR